MELPISRMSYVPAAAVLYRAVRRGQAAVLRVLAEETTIDGAVLFANPARAGLPWVNCAVDLNVQGGVKPEGLLEEIEGHFRGAGTACRGLFCAEADWPVDLAAVVEGGGYVRGKAMGVYVFDRGATGVREESGRLQVIPGRAAYQELKKLWGGAGDEIDGDAGVHNQYVEARVDRLDEARLEVFLGRLDREPVGVVEVMGLGQIGIVMGLYVDHRYRRKGVARELLGHAMEYCRRSLFEQVVLECEEGSAACGVFMKNGFRRVGVYEPYWRK